MLGLPQLGSMALGLQAGVPSTAQIPTRNAALTLSVGEFQDGTFLQMLVPFSRDIVRPEVARGQNLGLCTC